MIVTKISYEKCHNLGNYEHEKIRMEAELDDGEYTQTAMGKLIAEVDEAIETSTKARINDYETRWGNFKHMEVSEQWTDPEGVNWTVESKNACSVTLITGRTESDPGDVVTLRPIDVKNWHRTWQEDSDPMAEEQDAFGEE